MGLTGKGATAAMSRDCSSRLGKADGCSPSEQLGLAFVKNEHHGKAKTGRTILRQSVYKPKYPREVGKPFVLELMLSSR
jgi:hypothetical protein